MITSQVRLARLGRYLRQLLLTLPFDLTRIFRGQPTRTAVGLSRSRRNGRRHSTSLLDVRLSMRHDDLSLDDPSGSPRDRALHGCVSLCVAVIARAQAVDSAAPKPFEAFSNSAHSLRDSVVQMAQARRSARSTARRHDTGQRASTAAGSFSTSWRR